MSSHEAEKRNRLAKVAEHFHKSLVLNVPVAKIPEGTFVNSILPYLAGEDVDKSVVLDIAGAAGGPFKEYDVVSQTGEVLFRAPAVLDRNMFSIKDFGKGYSVEAIFQTAQMLNNRSPVQASAFISNSLKNRGLSANAAEIYEKHQARVRDILARYGKKPVYEKTDTANNSSNNDTGFDYEESVLL